MRGSGGSAEFWGMGAECGVLGANAEAFGVRDSTFAERKRVLGGGRRETDNSATAASGWE